jgi:hypothetical protein
MPTLELPDFDAFILTPPELDDRIFCETCGRELHEDRSTKLEQNRGRCWEHLKDDAERELIELAMGTLNVLEIIHTAGNHSPQDQIITALLIERYRRTGIQMRRV